MFPLEKYKYFTNGLDLVIAEQTFAGKKYRGVARCNPEDVFDYETGKKIAALTCNLKICEARKKYADIKLKNAKMNTDFFMNEEFKAKGYSSIAESELTEALRLLHQMNS